MKQKKGAIKNPENLNLYWQIIGLIAITAASIILLILLSYIYFYEPPSMQDGMVCFKYRFAIYCCDPIPYMKIRTINDNSTEYSTTKCIKIEVNRSVE
jgi:hypothetical protein